MSPPPTLLHILSGPSGAGKTTLCLRVAALLRETGVRVGGVVSPARFAHGQKTGIYAQSLSSGERRLLAERHPDGSPGWRFAAPTLDWGAEVLRQAAASAVLIVDEVGPLELVRQQGWTAALDGLARRTNLCSMVVVRPSLVADFCARFPQRRCALIEVTPVGPDAESVASRLLKAWKETAA